MARRTMTLKRIDPWSVLKFGFLVTLCLFVVVLIAFGIVWMVINQLGIIDQACELALDVGFEECAVDGGALFRLVFVSGLIGTVILTGVLVFSAFLHNLLVELVGGIKVTFNDESGARETRRTTAASAAARTGGREPPREAEAVRASKGEPNWTLGSPPAQSAGEDAIFPPREGS